MTAPQSLPCLGLGPTEGEFAAGRLGQLPKDSHGACLQVDVAAAERGQLGPPEAAEDREQNLPYCPALVIR